MATFSAPGRCGIIGNPSDMYGGAVISCSTRERAYCSVEPADQLSVDVSGETMLFETPRALQVCDSRLDVVAAAVQFLLSCADGRDEGELAFLDALGCVHVQEAVDSDSERWMISLRAWTELPMRAGLAGSSTLLTSILGALLYHFGVELNRYQMAEIARLVESRYLKVACGYQDAYMNCFGFMNYMDFRGKESLAQGIGEPLAVVERICPALRETPIVLAHTGVPHMSGSVHFPIRERYEHGERAVADAMERLRELAALGKKALLTLRWEKLGELMNENHAVTRSLGGSAEPNERLIQAALKAGAWGAKLAGAGGGGTIIAAHADRRYLMAELRKAGVERFLFPSLVPGLHREAIAA